MSFLSTFIAEYYVVKLRIFHKSWQSSHSKLGKSNQIHHTTIYYYEILQVLFYFWVCNLINKCLTIRWQLSKYSVVSSEEVRGVQPNPSIPLFTWIPYQYAVAWLVVVPVIPKMEKTLFVSSKLTFSKYLWCLNLALLVGAESHKISLLSPCFVIAASIAENSSIINILRMSTLKRQVRGRS